jgi:hypothetical protein
MWWRDMSPPMTKLQSEAAAGFTPRERDYIRRELDMFFVSVAAATHCGA